LPLAGINSMKASIILVAVSVFTSPQSWAGAPSIPPQAKVPQANPVPAGAAEDNGIRRADKQYEEMLEKMRAAVEEIAQLYGNPLFLQVFTNDAGRASELKQRLRSAQTEDDIRGELAELAKKRDSLLNDIALKEREAVKLAGRLVRQRAALDTLASAVDQARKAVEDTAR
jgi:hypothetical protein